MIPTVVKNLPSVAASAVGTDGPGGHSGHGAPGVPGAAPGAGDEPEAAEARTDGRVVRAQRLREERRSLVLSTARALFSERGYHNTSIHDIIHSADIARGTLYLY